MGPSAWGHPQAAALSKPVHLAAGADAVEAEAVAVADAEAVAEAGWLAGHSRRGCIWAASLSERLTL